MLTNSDAHSNLSLPSLQVPAPSHPRARTPVRTPRGNHRLDATDDEDDDSDPGTDAGPVARTSDWTAAFLHRLGSFQRRARRAEWVDDLRTGRGVRAVVGVLDRGRRWGSRLFVVQLRARTDRDGDGGKRTGRTSGGSKGEGMSGRGITIVVLLLLLGLRELFLAPSPRTLRPKVHGRQPFDVLAELAPDQSHALSGQSKLWFHEMGTTEDQYAGERGDTTAIVLHWKRTENVVLEVAHLCRYSFFRHVVVWNNNPDVFLTKEHFEASRCPVPKLRIYNSPTNLLFVSRFLACSTASTPNCYFQDDDWHVTPLRTLYSQFKRDPGGALTVHTGSEGAVQYGLQWCFFRNPSLHTCFAWLGTGAFVSRTHVDSFLDSISDISYTSEKLSHADNAFGLWRNVAPYVLSSELVQLPHAHGHSDGGAGFARNKLLIRDGLIDFLSISNIKVPPTFIPFPIHPIRLNTSQYLTPTPPSPHPYTHHARAPDASDTYVFLTNVPHLPPPDVVAFSGTDRWSLDKSERYFGWVFSEDIKWCRAYTHEMAVDNLMTTAWRSQDFVTKNDYIGVGLLEAIDPKWVPQATLVYVLEHSDLLAPALKVQVSLDGYTWVPRVAETICRPTSHFSRAPQLSFPPSYLSSLDAQRILAQDLRRGSFSARLWKRKSERSTRLNECRVGLETELGAGGWRFVRVVYEGKEVRVGWGVYEIWLE